MLVVLVGPSYSGKSTVCEFFKRYYKMNELPMRVRVVCPDDIREELLGDAGDQSNGKMIFETAYERVDKALNSPLNTVFFDATSLTPARRKPLIEIAKKHRTPCFAVVMPDFTEEELTARVENRERKVPLDVVRAQKDLIECGKRRSTLIRCANMREINFCPVEGEIVYEVESTPQNLKNS